MDKRLHDKLIQDVECLRNLLSRCSTESVVYTVFGLFLKWPKEDIGLSSPHRQLHYLLGLLLTTKEVESETAHKFDEEDLEKAKQLLEEIFHAYAWMFWPTPEEAERLSDEWRKCREVAMPAFLNYFNSGLLASTDQVRSRIERYLLPFDSEVRKKFEMSISEMLLIADSVRDKMLENHEKLNSLRIQEEEARLAFLDLAQTKGWDFQRARQEAQTSFYKVAAIALLESLADVCKIRKNDLEAISDKRITDVFWKLFTVERGGIEPLTYPTERNPALSLPLYLLGSDTAMVPLPHGIYLSILNVVEYSLSATDSDCRESFLKRRDDELEKEVVSIFQRFFGNDASILESIYENQDLQFEHDVVVLWRRVVFVVEAKASPPREPLRDPNRAFIRVRDDFRSERGIQKAFEQAHRIESLYRSGKPVSLYNGKKTKVMEISSANVDEIYCICVTRDNYGMLATDLSLLLQKQTSDNYPLAINILDLEALLDAFNYFGWGGERLCEYLKGRARMHSKVVAEDELDYGGYFIAHGDFDSMFDRDFDQLHLEPHYSEVFDRIFYARRGGESVKYAPHPPVTTNLSAELEKWRKEKSTTKSQPIRRVTPKQKRNDPCACGSGKKYKKCCIDN